MRFYSKHSLIETLADMSRPTQITSGWRHEGGLTKRIGGLLMLTALTTLAGCNSESTSERASVVATVDGEHITKAQLSAEIARLDFFGVVDEQVMSRRVLNAVVDRQILARKAISQQLQHDPRVISALNRAKEQVLANAYLEHQLGEIEKPASDEIHAYYSAHPELFENRRAYHFRQIAIDKNAFDSELKTKIDSSRSLAEIAASLVSRGVPFAQDSSITVAENLPRQLLKQIFQLRKEQLFVMRGTDSLRITELADAIDLPLSKAEATPLIERTLIGQRRKERADTELARLRASSQVELSGTYAEIKKEQPSAQADANYNVIVESGLKELK